MARVLETDAGAIHIRVCGVDDDYIMDFCPFEKLTDSKSADRLTSPLYREYSLALQKAYGGHAVAAWHEGALVAILTFSPEGATVPPEGMDYPRPCALYPETIKAYTENLKLDVRTGVLNMGCVAIYTGSDTYRRKGVGLAMVEEATAWADTHGYLSARALATPRTDDPEVWEKSADPGEAFWEAAGFEQTSRMSGRFVEMVRYVPSLPVHTLQA